MSLLLSASFAAFALTLLLGALPRPAVVVEALHRPVEKRLRRNAAIWNWIERRLVQSGLPTTPRVWLQRQLMASLVALPCALAAAALGHALLAVLLCILALAPSLRVEAARSRRVEEIGRALPDALDLVVLAVEAGQDLFGALDRVAERGARGPLREELSIVLRSIRVGESRAEALRGLAMRTGVPAVQSVVGTVLQAEKMGTPLGRALRAQARQLRIERSQRAEQRAGETPVRMLLPLLLFIFPTVFLVLLGPLAFQLVVGGGAP